MFGINGWEFLILAAVALVVLGPDKLPRYAADAGRMVRQLRKMAASAQAEVRRELGPEFEDISLADLNPRAFVTKTFLDGEDLDLGLDDVDPDDQPHRNNRSSEQRAATQPPLAQGEKPPYDADAT
jgi:sec-independent protein translocase protein TatB